MTAAERTKARLRRLAGEITADRAAFEAIAGEVSHYAAALGGADKPRLAVVALDLHKAYRAVEAILERVAICFEGALPKGAEWHRELLDAAALEIPGLRPAVLSPDSRKALRPLLGFRHFLSRAYAVDLDPAKLADRAADLSRVCVTFGPDLDRFLAFITAAADRAGSSHQ